MCDPLFIRKNTSIECICVEIEVEQVFYINCTFTNSNKDNMDVEDQDTSLTADEEDWLTKQFLNGELTFSEYSSRMDQDIDPETIENDTSKYGAQDTR